MKHYRFTVAILLACIAGPAFAQRGGGAQATITSRTENMTKYVGFYNFYWDARAESMWLEIDKWGEEFLYQTSTPANVSGSNRGSWGRAQVVRFEREGTKVFMIASNYGFRATTDDPLELRAVTEAYTPSIIHGFRVAAEEDGRVLVEATDFFMRSPGGGGGGGGGRGARGARGGGGGGGGGGGLDRGRSAFYWPRTKNFPKNTEIELTITTSGGGGTTTRRHHSFVELPDANYSTRRYDPRSGVSGISYLDYGTPFTEPIRVRNTGRHRIHKKDPNAAVSEPVEPIVYYVDPGAPEPIRSALVEGASWWNEAFEAAGYKDGFEVRVLPGDADPMDLRYNIIFWIHRPSRGWSSGSTVRDPRTGEIISGRVFLGSQRMRQDFLIASGLKALYENGHADTAEAEELVLARVRQLAAHEVGHTLGFGHNFAASVAGRASVMDYPHPNIKINDDDTLDFSDAYDVGIGEWDKVSVAFAYSDFPDGTDENAALDKILDDAHERGLFYLGTVGAGSASPLTHQWDNGPDALAEFEHVMRVREIALGNLSADNLREHSALSSLEEVLVPVYLFHRYQVEAVSKSIGGVDYRIAVKGDGQTIVEVVEPARQRRALDLLLSTVEPDALAIPDRVLRLIAPGGGGERFPRRTSPTFDPLAAAETAANHSLSLLLNSSRAARLISNRALRPDAPTLSEVIDTLVARTWKVTPPANAYRAEIHRVVDSVALHHLMALAANTGASNQVRAVAAVKIDDLKQWLEVRLGGGFADDAQRAHFYFAAKQIAHYQADPTRFMATQPAAAPAGAPIGMGEFPLPGMICDWDFTGGR